jgi:hypothetical protein
VTYQYICPFRSVPDVLRMKFTNDCGSGHDNDRAVKSLRKKKKINRIINTNIDEGCVGKARDVHDFD